MDAFYAENKDQREQIYFSEYNNRDDFVICIKSKKPEDLLFIVKSANELSL